MTLFYCGWNGCGQIEGLPSIIGKPTCVSFDTPIKDVSCSWSLLTVASEKSLTCKGFLGNQSKASQEIILPHGSKPSKVASCLNHVLISCDKGKCYQFNSDTKELRPIVNFLTTESPCGEEFEHAADDAVIKISCNSFCNLALSKKGRVYAIPSVISTPGLKVTDVSCGSEHFILLTEGGSVFSWGGGSRGQLGHGDLEAEDSPREVEALSGIQVHCISSGAWHNAVVTSSGDMYTWGWGSDGQLGILENDLQDKSPESKEKEKKIDKYRGIVQSYPLPVESPDDVKIVSCGSRHTVVLLVDGSVWGCGWNAYGQLGCSPEECIRSVTLRPISFPGSSTEISFLQCGAWSTCFIL